MLDPEDDRSPERPASTMIDAIHGCRDIISSKEMQKNSGQRADIP
jgi:hypothetical protein